MSNNGLYLGAFPSASPLTEDQLADQVVGARALAASALSGFALVNGYLDWSVAGSVLTVAVKTLNGTDPTADDPVYITFRSVTASNGAPVTRTLVAATSITIPDTATMGTSNSVAFRLWAVAFDDGGTVRLGLINALSGTNIYPLAGWGIASSTQDGTGSDLAHVFYSDGAAVTSKSYATLGFASWETGLATAGTWSAAPTRAQLFGLGMPLPGSFIQVKRSVVTTLATGSTLIPLDDTIPQNTEGDEYMTLAFTPTSAGNQLFVHTSAFVGSNTAHRMVAALFQDSVASALAVAATGVSAGNPVMLHIMHRRLAGSSSEITFKVRAGLGAANTTTFNGQGGSREFAGHGFSFMEVTEIMA